jgi:hypothetical protein
LLELKEDMDVGHLSVWDATTRQVLYQKAIEAERKVRDTFQLHYIWNSHCLEPSSVMAACK